MEIPEASSAQSVGQEFANRWLPRFTPAALETAYLDESYRNRILTVRVGLLLAALLFPAVEPLARIQLPEAIHSLDHAVRWYFQTPLILATFLLTLVLKQPRIIEVAILTLLIAISVSTSVLLQQGGPQALIFYELALFQIMVFGFLVLSFRFRITLAAVSIAVGAHLFVIRDLGTVVTQQGVTVPPFQGPLFFLLILAYAGYSIDMSSRRMFLSNRAHDVAYRERIAIQNERNQWLRVITDFLRHELKNALIGVTSSLELINRRNADRALDKYIKRADESSRFMKRLLEEVSASTNLESALSQINAEQIDLGELVREKLEDYAVSYPQHRFEIQAAAPAPVMCDVDRLVQLLDKLVNNAVEHGDPAHPIEVAVRPHQESVLLEVSDCGEALDGELDIFEPFVTGKARSSDKGFGLGLYVVKKIAEAHNGSVSARPRIDPPGAIFTVELPGAGEARQASTQR